MVIFNTAHPCSRDMRANEPDGHFSFTIDLINSDWVKSLQMVNVPDDYANFVASIPTDKRLEVTFARHRDDRQIRGVKQSLPKKAFRQQKEQEFHEHFGHMGCGKNCTICSMARGAM